MANRVTQTNIEVLRSGDPKIRVTQSNLEVLRSGDPKIRVIQASLEILIANETAISKSPIQNLEFTQEVYYVYFTPITRTVEHDITFTQDEDTIVGTLFTEVADNDITFTQDVTETVTPVSLASNDITFTQVVAAPIVRNRDVESTIEFTQDQEYDATGVLLKMFATIPFVQTVDYNLVINREVIDTLALTQQASQIKEAEATNDLTLTQDFVAVVSKLIEQDIAFTQEVDFTFVSVRRGISFFEPTQEVSINFVVNTSTDNTLFFTQNTSFILGRNWPAENNLTLTQELVRVRTPIIEDSTLEFEQVVEFTKSVNQDVSSNLELTQEFDYDVVLNFAIVHTLEFFKERRLPVRIGELTEILIPELQYTVVNQLYVTNTPDQFDPYRYYVSNTPVVGPDGQVIVSNTPNYGNNVNPAFVLNNRFIRSRNIMTLKVAEDIIVLPAPLFGDSEANTDTFTISKSIIGTTYTTIKRTKSRTLSYEFRLRDNKAQELENFTFTHNVKAITLTNWKGEIWIVRLINNPIEFRDQGRKGPCDSTVFCTLEFEGVRIH